MSTEQEERPTAQHNPQEIDSFLASIRFGQLTPAELEELARIDELKHRYNRTPWEI